MQGWSIWLPMLKSQQSWVRSQHSPTQWNLRDGRWSSVDWMKWSRYKKNFKHVHCPFIVIAPRPFIGQSKITHWRTCRLLLLIVATGNRYSFQEQKILIEIPEVTSSVADLDPDPYVFGPPGSGSISQRNGSGSWFFYHQAKIVRKTLIPSVLWLLTFIFEKWCKCTFKK